MSTTWLHKQHASAAVNLALRIGGTHKQVSDYLRSAAEIDPTAISDKIQVLKNQIALLESYLPKKQAAR